jgi:SNF2 family DNA or RNA helicase
MNITEKGRAIDIFTHDADYRVFLMSLKAGGVALNLTVASHVSLANLISLPTFAQQKFLKLAVNSTGGGDSLFF